MENDEDQLAKEEERLLRTLNARKRGVTSGVVGKSASNAASASTKQTAPSVRPIPEKDTQTKKAPKPQIANNPTHPTQSTHSNVLDDLLRKKSAVVSSINSGRRDLDELTNKIEQLLAEKARITDLQEKRQQTLQELLKQIEETEKKGDEDKAEGEKRRREEQSRREEEEERRRKEEMERWNREREEKLDQERRKREQDASWKVENRETSTPMFDVTQEKPASLASAPTHHTQHAHHPQHSQHHVHDDDEDEDQEAARIMRAMNRQRAPVTMDKPKKVEPAVDSNIKKAPSTQRDQKWVEAEAKREEERRRRAAEIEAQKKREEEERRKEEERSKLGIEEKRAKVQEILQRPGQHVTFRSPQVFDDTDVYICGSFSDWVEVPMQISNDALTYTITLPISSGVHFYRYKIEGKWEINRKEPTGVGPNGDICNKIDV